MDFKEQGKREGMCGVYLARGRNRWHVAVNVALCLRLPELAEVTDHSDILQAPQHAAAAGQPLGHSTHRMILHTFSSLVK